MLTLSMILISSVWAFILLPCVGGGVTAHILMIAKPQK
jgi:hypothetical protein